MNENFIHKTGCSFLNPTFIYTESSTFSILLKLIRLVGILLRLLLQHRWSDAWMTFRSQDWQSFNTLSAVWRRLCGVSANTECRRMSYRTTLAGWLASLSCQATSLPPEFVRTSRYFEVESSPSHGSWQDGVRLFVHNVELRLFTAALQ